MVELGSVRRGQIRQGAAWSGIATQRKNPPYFMTQETNQPNFKASAEAQSITKLLEACAVGETIPYSNIIDHVKAKGMDECRPWIDTARRILARQSQIVFGAVTGIGLKRLPDSEIVDCAQGRLVGIRRATKRAAKILACADIDKLDKVKRTDALRMQSQLGAVSLATSLQTQRRIEQGVMQSGTQLEIGGVLDLCKSINKE